MKKIPIKFRGKPTLSSDYIYGDYVTRENGCAIRFKENENLFNMHVYEVDVNPESVAQLVGYDSDGNEVYEGDELLLTNNIDTQSTVCCDVITAKLYVNVNLRCFRLQTVI